LTEGPDPYGAITVEFVNGISDAIAALPILVEVSDAQNAASCVYEDYDEEQYIT